LAFEKANAARRSVRLPIRYPSKKINGERARAGTLLAVGYHRYLLEVIKKKKIALAHYVSVFSSVPALLGTSIPARWDGGGRPAENLIRVTYAAIVVVVEPSEEPACGHQVSGKLRTG